MADDEHDELEQNLEDVLEVKRWLRQRRVAAGLTQEELGAFMGTTARVVLNAEREDTPKGLPRGYAFFRMLQRLGAVVPEAPVPTGPTLHDRLAALEAEVRESIVLTRRALAALDALDARPGDEDGEAPGRSGTDG